MESFPPVGSQQPQQQGHYQGAVDTVADHVADEKSDLLLTQMGEVVEISANVFYGPIPGGQVSSGTFGTLSRQQGLLDGAGHAQTHGPVVFIRLLGTHIVSCL